MQLNKICRTCLNMCAEMQSIFKSDQKEVEAQEGNKLNLAEIISYCAMIELRENDGLPHLICIDCVKNANIAFTFKQRCESSEKKLRSYLEPASPDDTNVKTEYTYDFADECATDLDLKPPPETAEVTPNSVPKTKTIIGKARKNNNSPTKQNISDETEQPLYPCEDCVLCFTELQDLKRHVKSEHSKKKPVSYVCKECNQTFSHAQTLSRHSKIHQEHQKNKLCTFCGKCFLRSDDLKRHTRIHTGERPYACDQCPKSYKQNSELKEHLKSHSSNKHYVCSICGKGLATRNGLYVHMKAHRGEKNHECKICGNKYITTGELSSHMSHIHSQEKKFSCTFKDCTRAFVTKLSLETHMRAHRGEKLFKCTICDKALATASSLHEHKRTHSGIKPKQCTLCFRRLGNSQALKKHMRIHTGERPYQCKICLDKFICGSSLNAHMKIKHMEKEHECTVCHKMFALGTRLRQHMKLHSSDKTFICSICNIGFDENVKLFEHMKSHEEQDQSFKTIEMPTQLPQMTVSQITMHANYL